jgi:hypothetical protein
MGGLVLLDVMLPAWDTVWRYLYVVEGFTFAPAGVVGVIPYLPEVLT